MKSDAYKFLKRYIKQHEPIICKSKNGCYWLCVRCINCMFKAECQNQFEYTRPSLSEKEFIELKEEHPELFI